MTPIPKNPIFCISKTSFLRNQPAMMLGSKVVRGET